MHASESKVFIDGRANTLYDEEIFLDARTLRQVDRATTPVTWGLIAINVAIYLIGRIDTNVRKRRMGDAEDVIERDAMNKLLRSIVAMALRKRSSDVHIEPHERNALIRCRVDGVLQDMLEFPMTVITPLIFRTSLKTAPTALAPEPHERVSPTPLSYVLILTSLGPRT